jgi:GAF domain-containing protein/HAMP domain-containing protein
MRWWQNQGLNFKVALGLALTLVIVLGLVFFGISQYIRAQLWQGEIQKTENINAIAKTLLDDAMLAGRKDTIQHALVTLGNSVGNQQLDSIAVYDDHYLLTSFATGFPGGVTVAKDKMPATIQDPSCWGCHKLPPAQRPTHLVVNVQGNEVIRHSLPLYNEESCQACHGTGRQVLGDIIVDYSQDQFKQSYSTIMLGLGGGVALAIGLVLLVLFQVLRRIVLNPMAEVVQAADALAGGTLDQTIPVRSRDELGILAASFNNMSSQLKDLVSNLEARVAERTSRLKTTSEQSEKRASELQTISDISRAISDEQELETLLPRITGMVSDRFGYYHVGIFLFDDTATYAVLRASNSIGGQRMLTRGHRLEIGQVGIVGTVAASGSPRIALDVGEDAVYFRNPDLPETRSELALPLKISGRIIGVLDVQSTEPAAFTNEDVNILTILADQIAIAIENARLLQTTRKSLDQTESAYRQYIKNEWSQFTREEKLAGYRYVDGVSLPLASPVNLEDFPASPSAGNAYQADVNSPDKPARIAVPVKIRDEVIGILHISTRQKPRWTDDEIDIVESVADHLALAIENARLFQASADRAAREQIVSNISSKISGNVYVNNILRTAAQELSQALHGSDVLIQIQPPRSPFEEQE